MADSLQLNHNWSLDLSSSTDSSPEIESDIFERDGFAFQLKYKKNSTNQTSTMQLHLVSLPGELSAIQINYSLHSPDTLFHKTRDQINLKMERDSAVWNNDFTTFISEDCDCDNFKEHNTIFIECIIDIVTKYGLFGGIYSFVDRPIFVQSSKDHKALVSGFINDLFDFDPIALCQTPDAISTLIHHYYLMMLLDQGESDRGVFEWRFTNKSDVSLFLNCKKGDVLTSVKFHLKGCEFFFELTPNGWVDQRPGQSCVWLAVSSLPPDIRGVAVKFSVKCAEIGLEEDRPTTILREPQNGSFSATANDEMNRAHFDGLEGWTFVCTVSVEGIDSKVESVIKPLIHFMI